MKTLKDFRCIQRQRLKAKQFDRSYEAMHNWLDQLAQPPGKKNLALKKYVGAATDFNSLDSAISFYKPKLT